MRVLLGKNLDLKLEEEFILYKKVHLSYNCYIERYIFGDNERLATKLLMPIQLGSVCGIETHARWPSLWYSYWQGFCAIQFANWLWILSKLMKAL